MAPKKATPTKSTKTAAAAPQHASYQDMIKDAISNLKERNGSSRQAIKKYIKANNKLGATTDAQYSSHINKALATGEKNGVFDRPKGASGPVKLKKPGDKKAAPAAKPKTETKAAPPKKAAGAKKATATKKTTTAKKAPAAKKPATKKAAAPKKAAPKKTAAKKTPTDAPAVVDKPAVLSKTSSGRVTKNKATPPAKKTGAVKKAAPKKKATPKKATPKKAA